VALTELMNVRLIKLNLEAQTKIEVLSEMVDLLASADDINDKDSFLDSVVEREGMGSTGIGKGVAIPHGRGEVAKKLVIAFGRSKGGVDYDALDREPVHLFFMLAAPKQDVGAYLKALAELSRLLKEDEFRMALMDAESAQKVINIIDSYEKKP